MCKKLNHFKYIFLLFLIVLFNQACTDVVSGTDRGEEMRTQRVVGGPCEYKAYRGYAKILSIHKKEVQAKTGGPSNMVYEVKFSFTPHEEIKERYGQVEGKEYLLLLANSSYPGPGFLKKYGITPGKCFECYLKIITRGTCTPVLFDFPTIDLCDYSESE
jgi:hypothetical protein